MRRWLQGIGTVVIGAAFLLLPSISVAQSVTVDVTQAMDTPSAGQTQITIELSTTGLSPSDTLIGATIDLQFDDALWTFSAGNFGNLGTHNNNEVSNCIANSCTTIGAPYSLGHNEISDTPSYVRTTIAGDGVNQDAGGYVLKGFKIGSTPQSVSIIEFDPVTAKGQGPQATPFQIDESTLAIAFLIDDDPNNNICDIGTCTVNNPPVGLPVELTDFSAIAEEEAIVLSWETATESDNAGFSIEYARGEEEGFTELTFVEGAGTTTEPQSYTYRAEGLEVGDYRFRLRQLDFDGAFEYSEVVETVIELAESHRLGAAYPNPFNPSTTFELIVARDQIVQVDIFNALGQRVQRLFDGSMEANKVTNFRFDAASLPSGLYFYRVKGEHFAQTRQMLLVK